MKILSAPQIRAADAATIEREPIASLDLMERAASACANWLMQRVEARQPGFEHPIFHIICGVGNNGGDGLVVARLLHAKGYPVAVYVCVFSEKFSPDFKANAKRLKAAGIPTHEIRHSKDLPELPSEGILVDALFGSGLSRSVTGIAATTIQAINRAALTKVAIDLPSGLHAEDNREFDPKNTVRANFTLCFELPKLAFLFPDNADFVGNWQVLPIGLDPKFIAEASTSNHYLVAPLLQQLLRSRARFSHKGSFGHVALLAGSKGKIGAAILAARAAMRSGAGLVTVHVPDIGNNILQTAVPEAMVVCNEAPHYLENYPADLGGKHLAIGPGIGTETQTAGVLKRLIQSAEGPVVFDADALNLLAQQPTWLSFLPPHSILTPHPGEFKRLVGRTDGEYGRHQALVQLARKHRVFVVLKGAHTAIADPDGTVYFNSTGNPGMATGGMGDALTGILIGLLAQGYPPKAACLLGVFLHGLAGDLAAQEKGMEALLASDVIDHLGAAFQHLRNT
ncbi:MAG: NAD(P)H-hydrate dehydratase [Salibacteraceae bacterium]